MKAKAVVRDVGRVMDMPYADVDRIAKQIPPALDMTLEKAVAAITARYPIGEIPRPPFWSGFRITPLEMEFWHDRPFRLHDRLVFRRGDAGAPWEKQRLYP